MSKFSEFSFRPHKYADGEVRMHGLVHVIDRSAGAMIGMLNPIADGGYVMRDRDGVRLGESFGSRFGDVCYTSRETAASVLRQRMRTIATVMERRAASVSAGCPNKWHNASDSRAVTACPECPTQPGLKLALKAIDSLISVRADGGDDAGPLDDAREDILAMIYVPKG